MSKTDHKRPARVTRRDDETPRRQPRPLPRRARDKHAAIRAAIREQV